MKPPSFFQHLTLSSDMRSDILCVISSKMRALHVRRDISRQQRLRAYQYSSPTTYAFLPQMRASAHQTDSEADGGLALNPQHALTGAWGAAKLEAGVARTSIACSKRANSRVNFGADLNSFKIDFAPSTPLTRSRRSPTWVAKQCFG